ncbi:Hypothetical protein PAU_01508 [Photorhabdus asymbiotica]|uniref:Uncharacterized protein n=1 Tax=Photorhabdus asymbiotica subsp. asymbiotica (strain ATCC 43949 / 3105-77) TaxID=553480 RepID=B6VKL2_PHOAA|nr:Hypothetical protein PAU_01508 [Photorhabdus asymbiotica]CAR66692.1 Hypothetical protein PA-RVA3-3976 [Photorhabdus asymbiotica subsp. asymbiotica ATCC 43949]
MVDSYITHYTHYHNVKASEIKKIKRLNPVKYRIQPYQPLICYG